jgi:two-component system chemotaxis response regulator CheY
MSQIIILVVEDEAEVREAIVRDLQAFEPVFGVETADNVNDARDVVAECRERGDPIGLVLCDHLMPGENGTDFLIELNRDPETEPARKVLITGQAGLPDTIKAINEADLDHYIAKPWTAEQLQSVVKEELTEFVLQGSENLLPYVPVLDGPRLLEAISHRQADR